MEQNKVTNINENGSYSSVTTTKTTPDDGFVHQSDIITSDITNYGEYHKGWQVNKQYETNNPKKVIPFLIVMMVFVAAIPFGVRLIENLMSSNNISTGSSDFSVVFWVVLAFAVLFEIMLIKEIFKVKKKFKESNNGHNVNQ